MTGQPATRRDIVIRSLKAVVFFVCVGVPMLVFGPIPVYVAFLWLAAIATSSFPLVYSAIAPWWRFALGRVIFGSITSTALLVDFTLWQMLTERTYEWVVYLGSALWASLAVHIFSLTRQLIKAQHEGNSRELDGSPL